MKKLLLLLPLFFFAAKAESASHPYLVVSTANYAAMLSSATQSPWSNIKAQAVDDLANATWRNVDSLGDLQEKSNAFIQLFQINALLYILTPASSTTYRNNILTLVDKFRPHADAEIASGASDYERMTPLNGAFFSMTIALDVIYPELSGAQISSFTAYMDSYVYADRQVASSWALSNHGMRATYEIFRGTTPAQVIVDTDCYHESLVGRTSGGVVCDGLPSLTWRSSERSGAQFNHQGGHGEGALYSWSRVGGASIEKIAKWGFKYVADFTGVDPLLSNTQFKNAVEWMYAAFIDPLNRYPVIGDTNNQYNQGDEFWSNTPPPSYFLSNLDFNAGRWSSQAAAWAARFVATATARGWTVKYPNDLISYVTATGAFSQSTPSVSYALWNTGAAFWDVDQSSSALYALLWNPQVTKGDHLHLDWGTVYMTGYGEVLLSNTGYNGSGSPAGGFPADFIKNQARGNNVVLFDNREMAPINPASTPFPQYGGNGLTEWVLSTGFDYASAVSTDAYTHRGYSSQNVSTGPVLFVDGRLDRNLMFVQPSTANAINGYWISVDEVNTTTSPRVNVLWHPYSATVTTTTTGTEFAWSVSSLKTSTTTVNIFLATQPQSVLFSSSVFAGGSHLVGQYINSTYAVDVASNVRAVTVIYPSDNTHTKSTFTRSGITNVPGAQILHSSTKFDTVLASSGNVSVSSGSVSYTGKIGFWRHMAGVVTQYFVRRGVAFDDGVIPRSGFTSDQPISLHMNGIAGGLATNTSSAISFYSPGITGVKLDGVSQAGTSGSNVFTATISSGTYDVTFTSSAAVNPNSSRTQGTVTFKGTATLK